MVHMIISFLLLADVAATGVTSDYDFDVARAARTYRIEVYNSFRLDRQEYDRRQEIGQEVSSLWKKSAGTKEDADRLIQWFSEATDATRPDNADSLPALPDMVRTAQSAGSHGDAIFGSDSAPSVLFDDGSTTNENSVLNETTAPNLTDIELPVQTDEESDGQLTGTDPVADSGTGVMHGLSRALLNAATSPTAPVQPAEAVAETTVNGSVSDIDFDELKARVVGYNLALAAINQQFTDDSQLTSELLLPIVDELTDLVQRHQDLASYLRLEGLSQSELRNVGELTSPAPTISRLSQRVTDARSQLEEAGGADSGSNDPAEIERLNELTVRLDELANRQ